MLAATAIFNVATYDHFRGSVYSAFHGGPVSPTKHHYTLANATVSQDGAVRFHAYLDAGTPEADSHIVDAALLGTDGQIVRHWDMVALSHLTEDKISNDFAYNKVETAPYGLSAKVGAAAWVTLPALDAVRDDMNLTLRITTVSGGRFDVPVSHG